MWISVRFMFFRVFSTLPTNVPVDEPLFCGNRRKPWRSWRSQKKRLNTPRFRVLQMGGVMFFCPDSHGCVTSVQFGAGNHLHGDDVPVLVVLVTRRARRRSVTSHCHPPSMLSQHKSEVSRTCMHLQRFTVSGPIVLIMRSATAC